MPAMLKGWIDRVWNYGWAYDPGTYPHRHVWMIGVCGNGAEGFAKRGYDTAIRTQLEVGILEYCGVEKPRLDLLHGSIEDTGCVDRILEDATQLGGAFADALE